MADLLVLGEAKLDRPTVVSLGVQLLISGDNNFDATVAVRYCKHGTADWHTGPFLTRVHPELVTGRNVPPQFAGSIIDLAPDTTYDIELHAVDPDGLDQIVKVTGKTRAVPRTDPATPNVKKVSTASAFSEALKTAKAGDVITLAKGTYGGQFSVSASGTAENPIVIRGEDRDGVILDGGGGDDSTVLDVNGSFVHVERLTIQNAYRALRWLTKGAEGNVLRRVHVKHVTIGTGSYAPGQNPDPKDFQKDFYISDNVFEGRLTWPDVNNPNGDERANYEGILVRGSGHVVCYNTVSGFGDALNSGADGARSIDFYGNEVLWTFDDGIELDGIEGNGRAWRNRFTNTYDAISFQTIYGGPVYVMRNVVVNVANEPLKLHATDDPSGVLVFHNTFVKHDHAIQLSASSAVHYYQVQNNLWIGRPTDGKVVNWDTPIDYMTGVIDANGYWPNGMFHFGYGSTGKNYDNFADVVGGDRYEKHGTLLEDVTFASRLTAPSDYKPQLLPQDVRLAAGSKAIDRAIPIPGINDVFKGAAPDLGAIEFGDPMPTYGPRPEGIDESNAPADRGHD